jgi:hypothetical protein
MADVEVCRKIKIINSGKSRRRTCRSRRTWRRINCIKYIRRNAFMNLWNEVKDIHVKNNRLFQD